MNKKSCFGLGCLAAFLLAVLVFVGFWAIGRKIEKDRLANQKPIKEEIALPAGTTLKDGIAISIMVDTSGSMDSNVPDAKYAAPRPKIEIARETAIKTLEELQKFADKNPDKNLNVGVSQFSHKIKELAPMGPMNLQQMKPKVEKLNATGGTAIGEAMIFAKQQLNRAALRKQNIIVITDGQNTDGREPLDVFNEIKKLPTEQRPPVYLIAFNIGPRTFAVLQDAGVMVLEANDSVGLQAAFDYILYEKILVEQP